MVEKGFELERYSKNSKIQLRTIKHHSNSDTKKQNSKKKYLKNKKAKKIKKILVEEKGINNYEQNNLFENNSDYQKDKY